MTTISNLPDDLLKEILCRVPMTSLRSMRFTCKLWNTLLKDPISKPSKEIMFITMYDLRVCLMSVNLHDHDKDLVYPFVKQIGELKLKKDKIHKVFHCNGLLLCFGDKGWLRVWNPYTGHQTNWIPPPRSTIWDRITSWIRPRNTIGGSHFYGIYFYGMGDDSNNNHSHFYGMGYDSNNNHKILKLSYCLTHIDCEIYDFKSRSWRIFDISAFSWLMDFNEYEDGVSLKGDNYFIATGRMIQSIICFDYTRETFRIISLPQYSVMRGYKALSLVREEKLAVLSWRKGMRTMEIWITDKIEPNEVSWSRFLKVDYIPYEPYDRFLYARGSFFVDEKKKVAVICFAHFTHKTFSHFREKAFMVGEGVQYREVELGESIYWSHRQMCSTYIPSLMQIQ